MLRWNIPSVMNAKSKQYACRFESCLLHKMNENQKYNTRILNNWMQAPFTKDKEIILAIFADSDGDCDMISASQMPEKNLIALLQSTIKMLEEKIKRETE